MKRKKITLKHALRIAKANGYDGDGALDSVQSWFDENLIEVDGKAIEFQVVSKAVEAKGITLTMTRNEGEPDSVQVVDGDAEAETNMDEGEDGEEDDEVKSLRRQLATAQAKATKAAAGAGQAAMSKALAGIASGGDTKSVFNSPAGYERMMARKRYDRRSKLTKPDGRRMTAFDDADTAEAFGAWCKGVMLKKLGIDDAGPQAKYEQELRQKTGLVSSFTTGGATVPTVFEPTLIDLREQYGVFERNVGVQDFDSAPVVMPRRTGDVTVYSPAEGSAITASDQTVDQVEVNVKMIGALSWQSVALVSQSALNMADETAFSMTEAMAAKIDDIGFNGDGTSTYFGFTGLRDALKGLSGTIANIAGLTVGAGNAYSELTRANLWSVYGKLPEYADRNAKWYCSRVFWATVIGTLTTANDRSEHDRNALIRTLFGSELEVAQKMPKVEGNSQVCLLYGDISKAAKMARIRGSMRFDVTTEGGNAFANALVGFRMLDQFGINVHDVGNASATAASREAGPVVGLITAAS